MHHGDDESGSASTVDVDSIVPARAIQQAAADHDVYPDALRAALQHDLERNQRMADRIRDRRPIVHEADGYVVAHCTSAVSEETPIPVLSVYRWMDDSDTDDLDGFTNVSKMEGDER